MSNDRHPELVSGSHQQRDAETQPAGWQEVRRDLGTRVGWQDTGSNNR